MNSVSNIDAYQSPTLWVELGDLCIPCAAPTVATVEEILAKAKVVAGFGQRLTQEQCDYAFDLFAAILSVNHNFVEYTPAELKAKRITVAQIMGVLTDWTKFIGGLATQKN